MNSTPSCKDNSLQYHNTPEQATKRTFPQVHRQPTLLEYPHSTKPIHTCPTFYRRAPDKRYSSKEHDFQYKGFDLSMSNLANLSAVLFTSLETTQIDQALLHKLPKSKRSLHKSAKPFH
ncbi:hypothetical protein V6N13_049536 [Hibiscus sabdariffa]